MFKFMLQLVVFVGVSVGCMYTLNHALDVPAFAAISEVLSDIQQHVEKSSSDLSDAKNSE